jgi:hypothetical protein
MVLAVACWAEATGGVAVKATTNSAAPSGRKAFSPSAGSCIESGVGYGVNYGGGRGEPRANLEGVLLTLAARKESKKLDDLRVCL